MSTEKEPTVSLFSLVEFGDKEKLLEIIEGSEFQKELSARDNQGRTALDTAALLGKVDIVQLLVGSGADLNKPNKSGTYTHNLFYDCNRRRNICSWSLVYM